MVTPLLANQDLTPMLVFDPKRPIESCSRAIRRKIIETPSGLIFDNLYHLQSNTKQFYILRLQS